MAKKKTKTTVLTNEIAFPIIGRAMAGMPPDSLELDEYTLIEDDAAAGLKELKNCLQLNGLTSLSDAAAASLGKHKGWLYLNGLTELSDAAARSLAKRKAELNLNGLTSLSDIAAKNLGKHDSHGLHLSLDPLEATIWSKLSD